VSARGKWWALGLVALVVGVVLTWTGRPDPDPVSSDGEVHAPLPEGPMASQRDEPMIVPARLPDGYAPPWRAEDKGAFILVHLDGELATVGTIAADGTVPGRGAVSICATWIGGDGCAEALRDPRHVETSLGDSRLVVITSRDPGVESLEEWRGIPFTDDLSAVTWLR
jgi:hypothetical protein